jgi:hypothetical protein
MTTAAAQTSKPAEVPKESQANAAPAHKEVRNSIQDFFTSIESEQGQSNQPAQAQFNM